MHNIQLFPQMMDFMVEYHCNIEGIPGICMMFITYVQRSTLHDVLCSFYFNHFIFTGQKSINTNNENFVLRYRSVLILIRLYWCHNFIVCLIFFLIIHCREVKIKRSLETKWFRCHLHFKLFSENELTEKMCCSFICGSYRYSIVFRC